MPRPAEQFYNTAVYPCGASNTGTHSMPLVIPNNPLLRGVHAYFQYGYASPTRAGVTMGLDANLQTK